MTYVIEKSIPMPQAKHRSKYPFRAMEIGDSVLFTVKERECADSAAYFCACRYKRKFRGRIVSDGFRIWRTA